MTLYKHVFQVMVPPSKHKIKKNKDEIKYLDGF